MSPIAKRFKHPGGGGAARFMSWANSFVNTETLSYHFPTAARWQASTTNSTSSVHLRISEAVYRRYTLFRVAFLAYAERCVGVEQI